jgi:hypothetical protein
MEYSRNKLLSETLKEVGTDITRVSKTVARNVGGAIKDYGKGLYGVYIGSMDSGVAQGFGTPIIYLSNITASFILAAYNQSPLSRDLLLFTMSEPLAKEAVRGAYHYLQSKKEIVKNRLIPNSRLPQN